MKKLKEKIYSLNQFSNLRQAILTDKVIHLGGLAGSFRSYLCTYIFETLQQPLLYIANSLDSAEQIRDDLELICGPDTISFIPATGFEPYDPQEPNPSLISLRLEAMQKFIESESWIAVTYPEGLSEAFPTPENFLDNQIYLKVKNDINLELMEDRLYQIGFERVDIVEKVGEYCVRGGIIDIFPWNNEDPFRIELFGNQIESLRKFDVLSQRSIELVTDFTILPNLKHIGENVFLNNIIPENTLLFFEDFSYINSQIAEYSDKAESIYKENFENDIQHPTPDKLYLKPEYFSNLVQSRKVLKSDLVKEPGEKHIPIKINAHPDFGGSIKNFITYLKKLTEKTEQPVVYIQCSNADQANRLQEIIDEEEIALNGKFLIGNLHGGFTIPELHLEVLTDHEIFGRFKRRKTYKRFKSGEYLRQLTNLNLNDYVVHIDYGIGKYLGMDTLSYGNVKKECIKIGYQDNDYLFVTVDRLNRVQKYSTEDSVPPKLTKLGGTEWERTKQKTKESLKKVAAELIQIYAGRKAQSGFEFSTDNHWQKELEASFIFDETEDQLTAISDVKNDMQSEKPMDRLLCGDVGFGKTEVALRAAFKAATDGKQSAVLVPTTILALQHYNTFKERLHEFPVNIALLNRFISPKQQKLTLANLAEGKIDIIIGTHRIISEDVRFKDLGLLVIDEEQRFGVKQKEKLKKYRLSVDVLSMTATPIPRTLHMALMGTRDLSHIDTPPSNRLPVHTEIIHWHDDHLYDIFKRELDRGGQVYFVHNRIETITGIKAALDEIIPEARIAIAHGQLPEHQLEKVMLDFMSRKYDILISTMIIENGLDIPNVNTIIINRADKFGLAQLYQLRGRVGRSDQQAYAYLLIPPMDKLTEIARKRLRAIQDFTDLGSGYKVALRDLEIRGAGNLLGKEQSGFVQSVGFELYCKILDEAVKELKEGILPGEEQDETKKERQVFTDPKLDVDFDLLIPAEFISNELERITIYHRLVNFSSLEQIENLKEELSDRFGKIPDSVDLFFQAIEIKVLTSRMYSSRSIIKDNHLKIFFDESAQDDNTFYKITIPKLMEQKLTKIKFLNQKDLGVDITLNGNTKTERLAFAKKLLQHVLAQG
jgi:transcription-repair coupling factor (superfamily II helicase)